MKKLKTISGKLINKPRWVDHLNANEKQVFYDLSEKSFQVSRGGNGYHILDFMVHKNNCPKNMRIEVKTLPIKFTKRQKTFMEKFNPQVVIAIPISNKKVLYFNRTNLVRACNFKCTTATRRKLNKFYEKRTGQLVVELSHLFSLINQIHDKKDKMGWEQRIFMGKHPKLTKKLIERMLYTGMC